MSETPAAVGALPESEILDVVTDIFGLGSCCHMYYSFDRNESVLKFYLRTSYAFPRGDSPKSAKNTATQLTPTVPR